MESQLGLLLVVALRNQRTLGIVPRGTMSTVSPATGPPSVSAPPLPAPVKLRHTAIPQAEHRYRMDRIATKRRAPNRRTAERSNSRTGRHNHVSSAVVGGTTAGGVPNVGRLVQRNTLQGTWWHGPETEGRAQGVAGTGGRGATCRRSRHWRRPWLGRSSSCPPRKRYPVRLTRRARASEDGAARVCVHQSGDETGKHHPLMRPEDCRCPRSLDGELNSVFMLAC
jgi:hypothetical protein